MGLGMAQSNNERQALLDAGSSRARLFHEIVHPIVSSLGGRMVSLGGGAGICGRHVLMFLFFRREDAREAATRVDERMKKIQYEVATAWRAASGGLVKVPSLRQRLGGVELEVREVESCWDLNGCGLVGCGLVGFDDGGGRSRVDSAVSEGVMERRKEMMVAREAREVEFDCAAVTVEDLVLRDILLEIAAEQESGKEECLEIKMLRNEMVRVSTLWLMNFLLLLISLLFCFFFFLFFFLSCLFHKRLRRTYWKIAPFSLHAWCIWMRRHRVHLRGMSYHQIHS